MRIVKMWEWRRRLHEKRNSQSLFICFGQFSFFRAFSLSLSLSFVRSLHLILCVYSGMNEWMNWIVKESAVRFMSISLGHFFFVLYTRKNSRPRRSRRRLRRGTPPASIKYQSIEKKPPHLVSFCAYYTICLHAVYIGIVLK